MQHSRTRTSAWLVGLVALAVVALALAPLVAPALPDWLMGGAALAMTAPMMPGLSGSPFYGLIPDELVGRRKRFFIAPIDWSPIAAASGGVAGDYKSDTNHDFIVHRFALTARDVAGAIVVQPRLLADFTLSGNVLFSPQNTPVDLEGIAGITGRQTPDLVIPLVIPAAETLSVMLRNPGAVALYVQLLLVGFRSERAPR